MSEDRVTHGALVDHPVQVERTVQTPAPLGPNPLWPSPRHPIPDLTWPAEWGSWDAECRGGRGRWVQT